MKVVTIEGRQAVCEVGGVTNTVHLGILEDVAEGDFVIVHVGFALQKIDPKEAKETLDLFREMGTIP